MHIIRVYYRIVSPCFFLSSILFVSRETPIKNLIRDKAFAETEYKLMLLVRRKHQILFRKKVSK